MTKFWICNKCGIKIGIDYDKCPFCDKPNQSYFNKEEQEISQEREAEIRRMRQNVTRSRDPRQKNAWGWHKERGWMKRTTKSK